MRKLNPGAILFFCLAASPQAHAQAGPEFLLGDWNVTSEYVLNDGTTEQTAAVATAAEEAISGTTTQIRHTLVGTRDGQDVEIASTFALNPANSQWVMMQADSVAGTVDVGSGAVGASGDEWTFESFPATRPDGGLERFHYTAIAADGYTLTVSRSLDGGTSWEAFWTLTFARAPGPVVTSPPGVTTCAQQEYGQFDFWLGEWDLVSSSGQSSGDRSSVQLSTGDCVVEEAFLPAAGGRGVSRAMYDGRTQQWARIWIEPGRMLIFVTGGLVNDDMIMTGGTTGTSQLTNRTVWEPTNDNSVRQFTQTSANNGATWTNAGFDATYIPQGSPQPPPPPPPSGGGGGGGSTGLFELLILGLVSLRRIIPSRYKQNGQNS
jgi:hypothetical protein